MRDATSGQLAVSASPHRKERERIWIEDAHGSLLDLTPWVDSWWTGADVEEQSMRAEITLHRETPEESLAPLMSSSPKVDIERKVVIEVAQVAATAQIQESDYHVLFRGTTDDISWPGGQINIPCRGPWGRFHDERIMDELEGVGPGRQEEIMQHLLDVRYGEGAYSIAVDGDPDLLIPEYNQQPQSVEEALTTLRDLNGWDLRFVWDDQEGDFRLLLREPPRDEEPVHTFAPGDYYALPEIGKFTSERRRIVRLLWSGGTQQVVDEEFKEGDRETAMILDFRQDGAIDTPLKAVALVMSAGRDVFVPPLRKAVEGDFFPFVELHDFYRFGGDLVHYLEDQDMAVTGFRHGRAAGQKIKTELRLYQRAIGSVGRWTSRAERDEERRRLLPDPEPPPPVELPGDVGWFYTQPDSQEGFSASSEASESLGGYVSTTRVVDGLAGVFRNLDDEEQADGLTLYSVLALANTHDTLPLPAARVWVRQPSLEGVALEVDLDAAGVVDIDSEAVQGVEIPDDETAPSGVSWSGPETPEEGLPAGDIPPRSVILVPARLVVAPGAESQVTDGEICAGTCWPTEPDPPEEES